MVAGHGARLLSNGIVKFDAMMIMLIDSGDGQWKLGVGKGYWRWEIEWNGSKVKVSHREGRILVTCNLPSPSTFALNPMTSQLSSNRTSKF